VNAPRQRRKSISQAGLTPLIDTLFLLLFALLALSDTRKSQSTELVHVQLSQIESGKDESRAASNPLQIAVGADARVWLKGTTDDLRSSAELDRALGSALGDRLPEGVPVEIHADKDAPSGVTLGVLQHLRLRGFVDVQMIGVGSQSGSTFGAGR